MKFSVFSASTPDWTPEETVAILAAQGWDGVEWRVTDQPPASGAGFWTGNRSTWALQDLESNIGRMLSLTRESGLEMVGINGYRPCSDHDAVERLLAATARLGARQVRITTPLLGSGNYRDLMSAARSDFLWVAQRAAHHGVKAVVELHHRTIIASASSALRLIEGLDPQHVGVIHDLGNGVIEGHEDYLAGFEMLGDYLAHIHVKNAAWAPSGGVDSAGSATWENSWAPMRNGQADVRRYFEALRKCGYDGWVSSEDFSTELPLLERTADNLAYLKEVHASVAEADYDSLVDDPNFRMMARVMAGSK